MNDLKSSKNKIQEICDLIKRDTLEPAREEADRLIAEAEKSAEKIVSDAKQQAAEIVEQARKQAKKDKEILQSNMNQAAKQAQEALRQEIETNLFQKLLGEKVANALCDEPSLAKLVTSLVAAIEKQGMGASLELIIPQCVDSKKLAEEIGQEALQRIKMESQPLKGGFKLILKDEYLTLDMSDQTVAQLLGSYVRKDFRDLFFS